MIYEVTENFIEEMIFAIKRHPRLSHVQPEWFSSMTETNWMMQEIIILLLAGHMARGKGKDIHSFEKEGRIFASCAGAAIYRKKVFEKIGYFDEEHFAYLEDYWCGYRARIFGYENWYVQLHWSIM